MKRLPTLLPLILLLFLTCDREKIEPESPSMEDFLNEVVDIMKTHAINRNTIDWDDFRREVLNRAASTAQGIDQTDEALELALSLLEDNHSFIRRRNGTLISAASVDCPPDDISEPILPDSIGYVRVTFFTGSDNAASVARAEIIQEQIKNNDNQDIAGWIVDLRGNLGGNMWPMLAGVGPILGEGVAGYFIDPDGLEEPWSYANGSSRLNQIPVVKVSDPYELLNPDPRVAVLLDQAVSSSGEAIAIAFIGRENTMSFGSSTCGLSTSNRNFALSDGSALFLTTAYMADRGKNIFGIPIAPDVHAGEGEVISLAIDYIMN